MVNKTENSLEVYVETVHDDNLHETIEYVIRNDQKSKHHLHRVHHLQPPADFPSLLVGPVVAGVAADAAVFGT